MFVIIRGMMKESYNLRDFLPLIIAIFAVLIFSALFVWLIPEVELTGLTAMRVFMGMFFLVFGVMKAWSIEGFADAFSMYDPLAKLSRVYARTYPFIELLLGVLFLLGAALITVSIVTLFIMLVGAYGVFQKLRKKERIPCACMGAVFKIPMTWVTLGEDLLMAAMAVFMLISLL